MAKKKAAAKKKVKKDESALIKAQLKSLLRARCTGFPGEFDRAMGLLDQL